MDIKKQIAELAKTNCDYTCQEIHKCTHDRHDDSFLCPDEIERLLVLLSKEGYRKSS